MPELPSVADLSDAVTANRFFLIADASAKKDGQPPFSDQALIDVRSGTRDAFLLGETAAAILSATEAEFVVYPPARAQGNGTAMLEAILARAAGDLLIWAHGDHPAARALARGHGLTAVRELLQLRMTVPAVQAEQLEGPVIRAARMGEDDAAWLDLNSRAFARHPEQGRVSQADLDQLAAEPWFDADDFLLAWDDDELVGYCWLKVEDGVGEFYVVGVAPERQGEGLGRQLMAAGFAHLRERGIHEASLYVDGDNTAALHLYRSLGFADHSIDIQYLWKRG